MRVQLAQRGDGLVHAFAERLGAGGLDGFSLGLGLGGGLFDGLLHGLGGVSHGESPEAKGFMRQAEPIATTAIWCTCERTSSEICATHNIIADHLTRRRSITSLLTRC